MVDRLRVKQVLLNLLSNAIKFTPDGGSVSVEAACDDGYLLDRDSERRERERRDQYASGLRADVGIGDGTRGTFSAAAVSGLVGSGGNPVVRQLEQINSTEREQLNRLTIIAERAAEIARMQAVFQ